MTATTHTPTAPRTYSPIDICERCGKPLNAKRIVNLELDQRDGTYHNFRDVPTEYSQGWFTFGVSCSYAELHKARDIRARAALAKVAQ